MLQTQFVISQSQNGILHTDPALQEDFES